MTFLHLSCLSAVLLNGDDILAFLLMSVATLCGIKTKSNLQASAPFTNMD